MEKYIVHNNKKIFYFIEKKNVKNINLKVNIDKKVKVSVPKEMLDDEVEFFIKKKANWIIKQQEYYDSFSEQKENITFENGETIFLLGKQYLINIIPNKNNNIEIKGKYIKIYIKEDFINNKKYINNVYERWLRDYSLNILKELVNNYQEQMSIYGIKNPNIVIRRMKQRWGSCLPQNNTLIFNLKLIKTPMCCIEYVVLHELCHFKYHNHSEKFYNFINIFMPDWKERKKMLDEEFVGIV